MDNLKSYEFIFLYLINKCVLLFKYIENKYQKDILHDIKIFINKLQDVFSSSDFENNTNKKNKILEILIEYFEKIIDTKIYKLINHHDKEFIIREVEKKALYICEKKEIDNNKNYDNENYVKQNNDNDDYDNIKNYNENYRQYYNENYTQHYNENYTQHYNENYTQHYNENYTKQYKEDFIEKYDINKKTNNNLINKSDNLKNIYENKDLINFENKINNKIKNIFYEIENNIKKSLKEYFVYTENVEYDLDKKFNEKMQNNNIYIENKIKEYIKSDLIKDNNKLYNHINNLVKDQIKDIYFYVENIVNNNSLNNIPLKNIHEKVEKNNEIIDYRILELEKNTNYKIETSNLEIKKKIISEIENKIKLLGNIFNDNIKEIFNNLNTKILDNEQDLIKIINEKVMNNNAFNKNNFNINFDKENNEIQLYYYNELITSTKINIKGLIGPKGPPGNKGDSGYTPIIRKIQFTDNNKIKFIIQEHDNIYEIISDNNLPPGPQGIQGERGLPGKTYMDLKWNQENVMRIDDDIKDSLIFLKSLCVGDKSHCLKDNSFAIGGAKCFQNNSFAIGLNSKTLDSESIALFGSCVGKKSYSYRADNVDENMVQFGKKERNNYNINSFDIISKEINIDCDIFKIKANKYENNKIKELEEKIINIEKNLIEILKRI